MEGLRTVKILHLIVLRLCGKVRIILILVVVHINSLHVYSSSLYKQCVSNCTGIRFQYGKAQFIDCSRFADKYYRSCVLNLKIEVMCKYSEISHKEFVVFFWIGQSVYRRVMSWKPKNRGSIPVRAKDASLLHNVQDRSVPHSSSYTIGTVGCFLEVNKLLFVASCCTRLVHRVTWNKTF
jgi:hypothetical protein